MQENQKQNVDDRHLALDDEQRVKVLSPSMLVFRRFVRNRLAIVGTVIIVAMFIFSFIGGIITPYGESERFRGYEMMVKDYAAITENNEYRYVEAEGKAFPSGAKSKMILALTRGEEIFEYNGQNYGLIQEGENLYRVTEQVPVATAIGMKGLFNVTPKEDTALPEDLTEAFATAVAAGDKTFATADGTMFSYTMLKKQYTIYGTQNLALASHRIFTEANGLESNFDFRLACERAIADGTSASFVFEGETYQLIRGEQSVQIVGADGAPVCEVSDYVIKAVEVGTVFPEGFAQTALTAIAAKESTFEMPGEDGEQVEYAIEHRNGQYIVRRDTKTYLLRTYEGPSREHWLGTDGNGMDMLTRLMYGGRISLMIGFIVVVIELVLGVVLGGVAGYFGGWIDNLLMRVVDIMNCIPGYPIYIILGSLMDVYKVDPTVRMIALMLVIGLLSWPSIARLVRGQILSLREQEFMVATEATGLSTSRRIFKHLVPNVVPQLIVMCTMSLGSVILLEATLSFLGLGVKFPFASWGNIINAVSNVYVMTNYWFVWIPAGMLILLTVLGFNFIGDGLRDAFDPKMKR